MIELISLNLFIEEGLDAILRLHLTLFSHRGGALFLEIDILPAFLLAPHPHANFIFFSNIGCGGKNNENV